MKQRRGYLFPLLCAFAVGLACSVPGADELPGYIYASSTLYETGYDYGPWCAQDYDVTTAWTEGASGPGYGETLSFETDAWTVVTGGFISTGYCKSEELFFQNGAPTRLYIRTGSQEAYLDVTQQASDYQAALGGFHFYFDEPLISDGTVSSTIVGVRQGWKYSDCCINELHFEGYQATPDTVPVIGNETPHVSLVLPYEDGSGVYTQDPYSNPDGLGGDGRGPEEMYTSDPEYLAEDVSFRLTAFANALYKLHCGFANPETLTIRAGELYSYSRAYMLNWYQAAMTDDRIMYNAYHNYAAAEDLKEILGELFYTSTPDEDLQALCDYFSADVSGGVYRMDAEADIWNRDLFYLDLPVSSGDMQGRTLLMGKVFSYEPQVGDYVPVKVYYAYFLQDPYNPDVFRFDELYTYDL